jgi:integrase
MTGFPLVRPEGGWSFRYVPANAHATIRRRAAAAGIETKIGNHSFLATGITAYLKNGGARLSERAVPVLLGDDDPVHRGAMSL